jgi:hypothetical protein
MVQLVKKVQLLVVIGLQTVMKQIKEVFNETRNLKDIQTLREAMNSNKKRLRNKLKTRLLKTLKKSIF